MYLRETEIPDRLARRFRRTYLLLLNKYYVDEIYDAMFVNRTKDLALALGEFDAEVIDGAGVNGVGWMTRFISRVSMWWDSHIVDGSVSLGARLVWLASIPARMVQSGYLQSYMLLIVIGLASVLGYYFYLFRH